MTNAIEIELDPEEAARHRELCERGKQRLQAVRDAGPTECGRALTTKDQREQSAGKPDLPQGGDHDHRRDCWTAMQILVADDIGHLEWNLGCVPYRDNDGLLDFAEAVFSLPGFTWAAHSVDDHVLIGYVNLLVNGIWEDTPCDDLYPIAKLLLALWHRRVGKTVPRFDKEGWRDVLGC